MLYWRWMSTAGQMPRMALASLGEVKPFLSSFVPALRPVKEVTLMLRVPSVNLERDNLLRRLEAKLSELNAVSEAQRGPYYVPWREEYLRFRIDELRGRRR